MKSESKQVYKYVTSVKKTTLLTIIAMVAVGLSMIDIGLVPTRRMSALIIGIILLVLAVIAIPILILTPMKIAKERLAAIEVASDYQTMLDDFERGYKAEGDRARIGEVFFFGKGTGIVCRIADIKQVKQYRQITKDKEMSRSIVAKLTSGNAVLCEFPGHGNAYINEPEYAADIRNVYRELAKANDKIIFDVRL